MSFLCCQAGAVSSDLNESNELNESGVASPEQQEIATEQRATPLKEQDPFEPYERELKLGPRAKSTETEKHKNREKHAAKNGLERDGPHPSAEIISNPLALDSSEMTDEAPASPFPQDYRALLIKMEKMERQRQTHHNEMMKMMKENFESLMKEIQNGRERRVSYSSMKSERSLGDLSPDTDGSMNFPSQDTPVSERVILKLSNHVVRQWKFLARELGMEEHEIEKIAGENAVDMREQSYQMLLRWTQSNGGGSYQELGRALRETFGGKLYSKYLKIVSNPDERLSILTPHSQ